MKSSKDDENIGNSSLTTAMQRLEALLNEEETQEGKQKIGEENKDLFAISGTLPTILQTQ